ncbi:alpha/beta fold hydrolase [Hymenobacter endophyticus]|uniref:Alpha/beta fold hydrolase n=1 Tax=Hymenobacter endophyticus TaxID=3076335 RepID=A0ABU3TFK9_9BACT|nr:alpha/beta fold hydrolase [Hymenobacter endophyticus]MDU0370130.1 alpha/beta fold hydrolase [Hymenobacter endophyticus]
MRLLLPAVLFLLVPFSILAQTRQLRGTVQDAATQAPVPFASVGVAGKPFGTVADSAGRFRFALPDSVAGPVLVSCVGYATQRVPVAALQAGGAVRLKPLGQKLGGVTVRPGKVRTRTFGRTAASSFMTARLYTEPGLVSDELGKEQGTIIPLTTDCRLRDANLFVAFNRFRSVTFRLLLYRVRNGQPAEPLPQPDIRFTVTQPRGWVKVDLLPYNLYLQGLKEVAVTVQWLRSEAQEGSPKVFGIAAVPLPGHSVFTRDKSQARWQQVTPGYLSLYLTADTYQTAGKRTEPEPLATAEDIPENYVVADSLKSLLFSSAAAPTLTNPQHYGSNPATGHYLNARGGRLYYERYGQGPPLLLLHGNGQSIADFQLQIHELARQFTVIALDTRGQGRSQDFTTQEYSYELFADDVRQLLDTLHLRRVHILGWSDGGNTALSLALHHPEYVGRLAIMGANLFPTPEAVEPAVLARFQRQLRQAQARSGTSTETRLLRLLVQEPHFTLPQISTIQAPVLVMAGQRDVIREAHTQDIARALPNGRLLILEGATHYAPQEVPDVFNRAVVQFFRRP